MVLMVIIIIFILEFIRTFAPVKGSFDYYQQMYSLIPNSCRSPQSTTNLYFNSPNSVVFQSYDNTTCQSYIVDSGVLSSNMTTQGIDNLPNNYDLCYGQLTSSGSKSLGTEQYYENVNTAPIYLIPQPEPEIYEGKISSAILQLISPNNEFSSRNLIAFQENGSNSLGAATIYVSYNTKNPISSALYNINTLVYANQTGSFLISFYSQPQTSAFPVTPCYTYSYQYANEKATDLSLQITNSECSKITNVTVEFESSSQSSVEIETNLSISNYYYNPTTILSNQCMGLVEAVKSGIIVNNSIFCQPILCGGSTFILTDGQNRPFLALSNEKFTFLSIQSSSNDYLEINNPNTETTIDKPPIN